MTKKSKTDELNLTEKQEAFVEAFISEALFDPIKAYNIAGYAPTVKPYSQAMEVLSSKSVVNAIHKRMAAMDTSFWMDEHVIIRQLWQEATKTGIGTSHAARINALVWIGKHLGMWQEKVQEQKDTAPVINITNYGVSEEEKEKMLNKIKETPEVEEHKDDVELPEGISIISYSDENVH